MAVQKSSFRVVLQFNLISDQVVDCPQPFAFKNIAAISLHRHFQVTVERERNFKWTVVQIIS
jgi:hypothetical protein